ncbi:MAG TPA: hypothetical protein VKF84_13575 [Candidatus Sulfotelmatobacter sp.]|nr:hypothetical protein [Candidatus Sulfotelmatobacter sp.]
MGAHNVDEAITIEHKVAEALNQAGVADTSSIRLSLVHDAEVHDGMVVTPDLDGTSVTIEKRIEQMRTEPRWRAEFPAAKPATTPRRPPPTPAGAMLTPTRSQFDEIVSGKAVVR